MNTQIEKDAAEFGVHIRQGGWRLGLLVARSVVNNGRGNRSKVSTETNDTNDGTKKTTATEFAEKSGTSAARVLRYLKAWDNAAMDGIVPESALLVPGEELDGLDDMPDWTEFYDSNVNEGGIDRRDEFTPYAEAEGTTTGKAIHVAKNKKALAAAIKADPEVEKAAYKAIVEKQAAKRERFIRERERAGISREVIEAPVDHPIGPMGEAMEYAVEEAGRRERIKVLQTWSQWGLEKTQQLVAEFNHTGVADEVEWLHEINHNLSEMQWALTGFIVENANENAR